ncbi:MAG: hypothetical protein K0S79_1233 [Nitrospira sp.]|nr:hypothetical protein [Nitrospira sp.]
MTLDDLFVPVRQTGPVEEERLQSGRLQGENVSVAETEIQSGRGAAR